MARGSPTILDQGEMGRRLITRGRLPEGEADHRIPFREQNQNLIEGLSFLGLGALQCPPITDFRIALNHGLRCIYYVSPFIMILLPCPNIIYSQFDGGGIALLLCS